MQEAFWLFKAAETLPPLNSMQIDDNERFRFQPANTTKFRPVQDDVINACVSRSTTDFE